jgi:hypothetical protein
MTRSARMLGIAILGALVLYAAIAVLVVMEVHS